MQRNWILLKGQVSHLIKYKTKPQKTRREQQLEAACVKAFTADDGEWKDKDLVMSMTSILLSVIDYKKLFIQ